MQIYPGLPDGEIRQISLPEALFSDLFPLIDDFGELRLTLYLFWRLAQREGRYHYFRRTELEADKNLIEKLIAVHSSLDEALERAVQRESILEAHLEGERLYFPNSPQGRAVVQAIQAGEWRQVEDVQATSEPLPALPNIFRLYEENIGPLTPLIADAIAEAENEYPIEWIQDAIRISTERNKRSWRYTEAILRRWQREGRDVREKQKDQREPEEARRRYVEGEFSDFVEH